MSDRDPSEAFDLDAFGRLLEAFRSGGGRGHGHLCTILGLGAADDMDAACRRAQRIIDAIAPSDRTDPRRIDPEGRRWIAAEACVDPTEVDDLLLRFNAVASAGKDSRILSLWMDWSAGASRTRLIGRLRTLRDRDTALWSLVADA